MPEGKGEGYGDRGATEHCLHCSAPDILLHPREMHVDRPKLDLEVDEVARA
jgi:hypothetical protein